MLGKHWENIYPKTTIKLHVSTSGKYKAYLFGMPLFAGNLSKYGVFLHFKRVIRLGLIVILGIYFAPRKVGLCTEQSG